ncbi:nuclear transport factor 2 family protein [Pseudoxanthomonas beigongshangi]
MTTQNDIMELERQFWQAIVDMDVDTAISLLDEESVSVSGWGIHHFSPAEYREMVRSDDARVTAFKFSEERVIFPTPDVAIATYKADQSITVGGKSQDMVVYDTTTWVRKDGTWVASAHTETARQANS